MRSAYRGLNYLIAALVLIQAAAISYAIAGVGYWVNEEGGVIDKALMDSDDAEFRGLGGFMTHGINGMMIIPIIVLVALLVSFFTKIPGAVKSSAILLVLVIVQIVLGIASHSVPYAVMLHALNAFLIFALAAITAYRLRGPAAADSTVSAPTHASV